MTLVSLVRAGMSASGNQEISKSIYLNTSLIILQTICSVLILTKDLVVWGGGREVGVGES